MLLPFRRVSRPVRHAPGAALPAPPAPEQRLWEVQALLCTLSAPVREALFRWLLAPTDPERWPPPDTFSERLVPLRREEYWDEPPGTVCRLLRDDLRAIRYTLDLPPEALSGLTRNGLLAVHAIRLRQLEWRLWPRLAARTIREMTA